MDPAFSLGLLTEAQVPDLARARLAMFRELDPGQDYLKGAGTYLRELETWYRQSLGSAQYMVLIAWRNGVITGFGHLRLEDRPPHPAYKGNCHGHVSGVYVLPSWRRQGLATAIMEKLHELARKQGVKRLHLHSSDMAPGLYRRLGYRRRENAFSLDL